MSVHCGTFREGKRVITDQPAGPDERLSDPYLVRSVARALDLLLELGDSEKPIGLTELARRTDLSPATALRLLDTLSSRGLVRRDNDRQYGVGSMALDLGASYLRNIHHSAKITKTAEHLAEITQETVSIGILDGGEILYLSVARGRPEVGIASSPGVRHPLHCTALGKAILANMTNAESDSLLRSRHLRRLSSNTITDVNSMHQDLDVIRRRGYSIDDRERSENVRCIGAPFYDTKGKPIGAISISGPESRMEGSHFSKMVHPLLVAAEFISTVAAEGPAGISKIG